MFLFQFFDAPPRSSYLLAVEPFSPDFPELSLPRPLSEGGSLLTGPLADLAGLSSASIEFFLPQQQKKMVAMTNAIMVVNEVRKVADSSSMPWCCRSLVIDLSSYRGEPLPKDGKVHLFGFLIPVTVIVNSTCSRQLLQVIVL